MQITKPTFMQQHKQRQLKCERYLCSGYNSVRIQ